MMAAAPGITYRSGRVRQIAELTSHDTAMKFVMAFHGKRIFIPVELRNGLQLVEALGSEAAERIIRALAREFISVPMEKENVVLWLRDQGYSYERIAHTVWASSRNIQYFLNSNMPTLGEWFPA